MGLSNAVASASLLLLLAGCDGPTAAIDASHRDAGAPPTDGGASDARASDDAQAPLDAGPPGCLQAESVATRATDRFEDPLGVATVTIEDRTACLRTYSLASTAMRRDMLPASPRVIVEREGAPSIRTGHDLFDALYALAVEEARQNAVEAISDHAFDEGRPVDCGGCYETGRLWNYVWTRDTAYAAFLGLAPLDPSRMRRSLEFKTSERRGGGGLEIVQDTGTGGSWPVSTDRVSWALGAYETLHWLDGDERAAFSEHALGALRNTIERDRRVIFDPETGLYRGETSFLDWREQSYPDWTAREVVHIAMSRALSTNVLHLRAIEIAAELARARGDLAAAGRWRGWADALRSAIRARFWDEERGLFAAYLSTELDPSPVRRWDLLGNALAILFGVAEDAQAQRILANYPHVGPGSAPVIAPQQQWTPIYHNRAEWPFVTALWLRAAQAVNPPNAAAGDRAIRALIRAAALFLSNVENLETATGAAWVEDGPYSGPVVHSQRQLWSVAGYLDLVQRVFFGISAEPDGIRIAPWIDGARHAEWLAGARTIVLRSFPYRGHTLDVVVHLPATPALDRSYELARLELDGITLASAFVPEDRLGARSRIDVHLAPGPPRAGAIRIVDPSTDWRAHYGPRTPRIASIAREGTRVRIAFDLAGEEASEVQIAVYRDGVRVADALPGTTPSYLDTETDAATRTHCWAIETCFVATGTCSQHSPPSCFWGDGNERVTVIDATRFSAVGGEPVTMYGRFHYQAWGDPGDRLEADGITVPASGHYLLQAVHGNGGPVDTGISCGLKRVLVEDRETGAIVGSGILVMPHLGSWDRWGESSFVPVDLLAGRPYRIIVRDDDDAVNMSHFQHFATYTAGAGGRDGPFARVNVAEIRLLRMN